MLIVCKDTDHAAWVEHFVKSDEFREGAYQNKTIIVHSKQKGAESDANTRLLLDAENPENPVEIVIHVNMLKEGWDVNNLYTIVPLRTAASKILREQMVGRTGPMLSFDKLQLLVYQVVVAALGEEIAFRGFFVGKAMKLYPFWLCAVVSSVLFAAGHIAAGDFWLVFFDVATIFVDALVYAVIYKKSGNCLVSTLSHILCNATGIAATFFSLCEGGRRDPALLFE